MVKIFFEKMPDVNKVREYIKKCKFSSSEFNVEIYSEEGIFLLEKREKHKGVGLEDKDTFLHKLLAIDATPEKMILDSIHLLIDNSYFEREIAYQLPSEHIMVECKYEYYKLHNKSQIRLVVKTLGDELKEYYYLEMLGEKNDKDKNKNNLLETSIYNELNELVSSLS